MKLKKLNIELQWYGDFCGQYIGKVEFEDQTGWPQSRTHDIINDAQMIL